MQTFFMITKFIAAITLYAIKNQSMRTITLKNLNSKYLVFPSFLMFGLKTIITFDYTLNVPSACFTFVINVINSTNEHNHPGNVKFGTLINYLTTEKKDP